MISAEGASSDPLADLAVLKAYLDKEVPVEWGGVDLSKEYAAIRKLEAFLRALIGDK